MKNKNKFILSIVMVFASIILLAASAILASEEVIGETLAVILIVISALLVFAAISFAAKIDYETGVYECRNCGHVFKPTFKAYLFGPHTLTTRCLKCPECNKSTWCKRIAVEKGE